MAILNFPNTRLDGSPLQSGDQYTGDNGVTYIFDGVKWVGRAVAQPAGTNSITNNGNTVQVDVDGNLVLPVGSTIIYEGGAPAISSDRLVNGSLNVHLDSSGHLVFPAGSEHYDLGAGEGILSHNIDVNTNSWAFGGTGILTIPGSITAQDGNDLNLTSWNPTVDGIPGGVTISLQNRDIETGNRNTKLDIAPDNITLITDFSNAENTWTFGADGSLSLPTGGNIIGAPTGPYSGLIQLTPFNDSGYLNNGQYLNIYPTRGQDAPHIHIAAGTGGESNGDLILGDDEHYVDINHDGSVRVKTKDPVRGWTNDWVFTSEGTLSHYGTLYVDGTIEASYGNPLALQGSFFTRHSTTVQFSNADGTDKDSYIANSGYWNLSGITNPNVYGATVYVNGSSYYTNGPVTAAGNNDHTFTFGSMFTLQANISYTVDWWEYNPQSVILNGGENTWEFKPDGSAQLPNNVKQNTNPSVVCNTGTDTVVYTGSDQYLHTFKLLIKVEGHELSAEDQWETQSTEMIIAKSFNGDKVAATAYGVVHTSVDPLATFTARWNPTISRVEVLCRPTSLTYPVDVRTFATEIFTSD
jgi:hypothetical protein